MHEIRIRERSKVTPYAFILCCAVFPVIVTDQVQAQQGGVGAWVAAGIGPGWHTSNTTAGPPQSRGLGYSGRGGLTLGRLGLGVELAKWWTSLGSDTHTTNRMLIATVRPTRYPLYVKAGAGDAVSVLGDPNVGSVRSTGLAVSGGLSAEVPILRLVSLGINLDLVVQRFGWRGEFPATINDFVVVGLGPVFRQHR